MTIRRTLLLAAPGQAAPGRSALPADRWYPARLAEAAAFLTNAKLIDAAAEDLTLAEVVQRARGFELCLLADSPEASGAAGALRASHPGMTVGILTARPVRAALQDAEHLDFALPERRLEGVAALARGRPPGEVPALAWRDGGGVRSNPEGGDGPGLAPAVLEVYLRDLRPERYAVGCLRHPYLSLPAGGSPLPDPAAVLAEARRALRLFPGLREIFLEGHPFAGDPARAEELAEGLGSLGVAWSAEGSRRLGERALRALARGAPRLLWVDFGSGSRRVLEASRGERLEGARALAEDCRRLGLPLHGDFTLGLPGETPETVRETLRFACAAGLRSISVRLAPDPLPLPRSELEGLARRLLMRFYARPGPVARVLRDLARDPEERRRLLGVARALLRRGART